MSKTQRLLTYLKTGRSITGKQALEKFGLYRLSDAIMKLKRRGHNISTVLVKEKGDTYGKYIMK